MNNVRSLAGSVYSDARLGFTKIKENFQSNQPCVSQEEGDTHRQYDATLVVLGIIFAIGLFLLFVNALVRCDVDLFPEEKENILKDCKQLDEVVAGMMTTSALLALIYVPARGWAFRSYHEQSDEL